MHRSARGAGRVEPDMRLRRAPGRRAFAQEDVMASSFPPGLGNGFACRMPKAGNHHLIGGDTVKKNVRIGRKSDPPRVGATGRLRCLRMIPHQGSGGQDALTQ